MPLTPFGNSSDIIILSIDILLILVIFTIYSNSSPSYKYLLSKLVPNSTLQVPLFISLISSLLETYSCVLSAFTTAVFIITFVSLLSCISPRVIETKTPTSFPASKSPISQVTIFLF